MHTQCQRGGGNSRQPLVNPSLCHPQGQWCLAPCLAHAVLENGPFQVNALFKKVRGALGERHPVCSREEGLGPEMAARSLRDRWGGRGISAEGAEARLLQRCPSRGSEMALRVSQLLLHSASLPLLQLLHPISLSLALLASFLLSLVPREITEQASLRVSDSKQRTAPTTGQRKQKTSLQPQLARSPVEILEICAAGSSV